MATSEQLVYPQCSIAMDNGDLVQVTNFTVSLTNGAKQVHLLRKKGAGIVFGNEECSVKFDFAIDEDGPEKNYWRAVKRKEIKQIRAKAPGGVTTLTVNGAFQSVDLDSPLDDFTKGSCNFIGRMEEPETKT